MYALKLIVCESEMMAKRVGETKSREEWHIWQCMWVGGYRKG